MQHPVDPYQADPYREEEALRRMDRRERWRMISQIGHLAALVAGILALLALLALLFSMITFARQSVSSLISTMFGGIR